MSKPLRNHRGRTQSDATDAGTMSSQSKAINHTEIAVIVEREELSQTGKTELEFVSIAIEHLDSPWLSIAVVSVSKPIIKALKDARGRPWIQLVLPL